MSEQHSILPEQQEILDAKYETVDRLLVSQDGWTTKEIEAKSKFLASTGADVIFLSPIPYLIKLLAVKANIFIFHNSNREKLELPNGKIISKVAKTGWELV